MNAYIWRLYDSPTHQCASKIYITGDNSLVRLLPNSSFRFPLAVS